MVIVMKCLVMMPLLIKIWPEMDWRRNVWYQWCISPFNIIVSFENPIEYLTLSYTDSGTTKSDKYTQMPLFIHHGIIDRISHKHHNYRKFEHAILALIVYEPHVGLRDIIGIPPLSSRKCIICFEIELSPDNPSIADISVEKFNLALIHQCRQSSFTDT